MRAPPIPLALASSANSRFQLSKPAGVLPHCAASDLWAASASITKEKKIAVSARRLIIGHPLWLFRQAAAYRITAGMLNRYCVWELGTRSRPLLHKSRHTHRAGWLLPTLFVVRRRSC